MASSSSHYSSHYHRRNHPASSPSSSAAAASSISASSRRLSSSSHEQQHQPFAAALRDQEHEHQPPILRWSNDAHSGGVGERLFAAHYSLNPTAGTSPNHAQHQHQQHQHQQLSSDYPYPASLSFKSTSYMDPSGRSVLSAHIHNNPHHHYNGASSRGPHHAAAPAPSMSDIVPSLDYDASSVAESSVNTFKSGQGPTARLLEEGHDGVLQIPSSSNATTTTTTHPLLSPHQTNTIIYDCAFSFLGCTYLAISNTTTTSSLSSPPSDAEQEWKTHVLSHFHSHLPPRNVSCPLCDWGFAHASGARAWDCRMNHVAAHHRAGQRLDVSSSGGGDGGWIDSGLFRYLWQKRIISDAEYQDLSCGGALRGPRTATMGAQAEGRRERREHHARRLG
ncbi:hypothetical protein IWX48DRAFT_18596 [Phyllosticta citricarpa]